MTKINRRSFVKGAAIGAVAAPLATPALAQERIEMAIVATWGRDFPGLGTGAQRYAQTIQDLSGGRIQVSYYECWGICSYRGFSTRNSQTAIDGGVFKLGKSKDNKSLF